MLTKSLYFSVQLSCIRIALGSILFGWLPLHWNLYGCFFPSFSLFALWPHQPCTEARGWRAWRARWSVAVRENGPSPRGEQGHNTGQFPLTQGEALGNGVVETVARVTTALKAHAALDTGAFKRHVLRSLMTPKSLLSEREQKRRKKRQGKEKKGALFLTFFLLWEFGR